MKKIKLLIIILINLLVLNVDASTNIEKRSESDLKIHSSIVVNSNNIDNILNTPKVNEKEKVYDFADLFTDHEESIMYNKIQHFINLSNYDLAVVTINENNKKDEQEYADDFYDYNYFGFDDSFSGLLILVDMDNRGVYIATTGLAIKMYDNYRINKIIDYGWNPLVNGEYGSSVFNMIYQIENYYENGFPSSNDNLVIDGSDVYYDDHKSIGNYIKIPIIASIIITVIVAIIMYTKTRLKIKTINVVSYLVKEQDININKNFLRSYVTKVKRNHNDSNSGSFGSISVSSSHSSSSGRSHGGGGRRF